MESGPLVDVIDSPLILRANAQSETFIVATTVSSALLIVGNSEALKGHGSVHCPA
ncbi:hypothetical protein XBKB1_4200005 [Xenorhabdus bovienii str. kraussei Becker Underwood]|uniref:Uncharacterized protein n=1 Tax=Xenorhabdus bovienii str. kraussei Becker Underwood TaxID=1398204 RepID=A0A077PN69_XENBV|nr:hypothetical protein XBKB1_4200005 [Xenorhabdus bovienii str. kraussei Becker Underwood]